MRPANPGKRQTPSLIHRPYAGYRLSVESDCRMPMTRLTQPHARSAGAGRGGPDGGSAGSGPPPSRPDGPATGGLRPRRPVASELADLPVPEVRDQRSADSGAQPAAQGRSGVGSRRPRVVLCDSDPMARRMVHEALRRAGLTVIAQTGDLRDAADLALRYRPEVLLLDVSHADGIENTRRVTERVPGVAVLLFSAQEDPELGMRGLRAGASGYVSKESDPAELAAAVERVAAGHSIVSDQLLRHLIEYLRAVPEGGHGMRPVSSPLTSREWEVLDLLSAGLTIDDITNRFVVSTETVRSHLKHIMRKLGVRTVAEAVETARRLRAPY